MRSGWDRGLEMHPEYTSSLKSPRRIISEVVCFQTTNWAINYSKKILWPDRKLSRASKYHSCCSCTVVPAELADLGPEGWYAITILFFYHQSQLSTSTNGQGWTGQLLTLPPWQKSVPLPSLHTHHADSVAFIHLHCGQQYF
jgi:hypothetical protein